MRGVNLRRCGDLAGCDDTAALLMRMLVLWCLRERADSVHVSREEDTATLSFRRGGHFEELIPPPPYLVDELVRVLTELRPTWDRWADWWRGERNATVKTTFEGTCPLAVGSVIGSLTFSVWPYAGGVLICLQPSCEPNGIEEAAALLAEWRKPGER